MTSETALHRVVGAEARAGVRTRRKRTGGPAPGLWTTPAEAVWLRQGAGLRTVVLTLHAERVHQSSRREICMHPPLFSRRQVHTVHL